MAQRGAMKQKVILLSAAASVATVLVLSGCGQSDSSSTPSSDTSASSSQTTAASEPVGETVDIKMRGTKEGYSFQPNQVVVKAGDKVRFTMVDGGPHNVSFNNQTVPNGANMVLENKGKLVGALLQAPNQTYEIQFTKDLPGGEYNFVCDPHNALGMYEAIVEGEVPVGIGPLHTQFDGKGNAYTSLYIDSAVAKWKMPPWTEEEKKDLNKVMIDKIPVNYAIGHLVIGASDTKEPYGKWLIAMNKMSKAAIFQWDHPNQRPASSSTFPAIKCGWFMKPSPNPSHTSLRS
jgi:plastocyanin